MKYPDPDHAVARGRGVAAIVGRHVGCLGGWHQELQEHRPEVMQFRHLLQRQAPSLPKAEIDGGSQ